MNKIVNFKRKESLLPDDLMKIREFCEKYGCDISYPYKLRDRGKLKLYRFGTYKLSEKEAIRVMES